MADGVRVCGRPDGHKDHHRSIEGMERKRANCRRYYGEHSANPEYRERINRNKRERKRWLYANDPEFRERCNENKRKLRANNPELRERERDAARNWRIANPLKLYELNARTRARLRQAQYQALMEGDTDGQ